MGTCLSKRRRASNRGPHARTVRSHPEARDRLAVKCVQDILLGNSRPKTISSIELLQPFAFPINCTQHEICDQCNASGRSVWTCISCFSCLRLTDTQLLCVSPSSACNLSVCFHWESNDLQAVGIHRQGGLLLLYSAVEYTCPSCNWQNQSIDNC